MSELALSLWVACFEFNCLDVCILPHRVAERLNDETRVKFFEAWWLSGDPRCGEGTNVGWQRWLVEAGNGKVGAGNAALDAAYDAAVGKKGCAKSGGIHALYPEPRSLFEHAGGVAGDEHMSFNVREGVVVFDEGAEGDEIGGVSDGGRVVVGVRKSRKKKSKKRSKKEKKKSKSRKRRGEWDKREIDDTGTRMVFSAAHGRRIPEGLPPSLSTYHRILSGIDDSTRKAQAARSSARLAKGRTLRNRDYALLNSVPDDDEWVIWGAREVREHARCWGAPGRDAAKFCDVMPALIRGDALSIGFELLRHVGVYVRNRNSSVGEENGHVADCIDSSHVPLCDLRRLPLKCLASDMLDVPVHVQKAQFRPGSTRTSFARNVLYRMISEFPNEVRLYAALMWFESCVGE